MGIDDESAQAVWSGMMSGRTVALDLETTGLSPNGGDRIVSIGLVCIDNGVTAYEWQTLVNPERDGGMIASKVHKLSDEQLAAAPTFDQVAPTLLGILSGARALAAHNARFDWSFLVAEFEALGHEVPDLILLDTQRLIRYVDLDCANEKLATVAEAMGVTSVPDHTSLGDARVVADIVLRTLWHGVRVHDWACLEQVAMLAPVTLPVQGEDDDYDDDDSLTLTIDIGQLLVESMQRDAARTPEQRALRDKYKYLTDWDATDFDPTGWETFVSDVDSVFPEPGEDRVGMGDWWCDALSRDWKRTSRRDQKVALVPWVLRAIEWQWQQGAAAGLCRADNGRQSYDFCQALAYTSPEEGIPHMKWASDFLNGWPVCGHCGSCETTSDDWVPPVLNLHDFSAVLLDDNWRPDPETVRMRYAAAMEWLRPMAAEGLTEELAQVGRETFFLVDRASLWDETVEVGRLCIDNGVRDFGVADRLALVLERKVADPEGAMTLCRKVDTWPVGRYDSTSAMAIAKRLARLEAKAKKNG